MANSSSAGTFSLGHQRNQAKCSSASEMVKKGIPKGDGESLQPHLELLSSGLSKLKSSTV